MASADPARALLRHFLAALAYRTQKALRGAPAEFADFRAAPTVRTPHELVWHMTGVIGYARTRFAGGEWRPERMETFAVECPARLRQSRRHPTDSRRRAHPMRFFTPEWHGGGLDEAEAEAAVEAYRRHLDALRPSLPPALEELSRTSLHDGLIRRAVLDPAGGALRLELRCGSLGPGYHDLDLVYRGVDLERLDARTLALLACDPAAEALYDEIDRAPDGRWEHRILFIAADYAGIAIAFERLDLARAERPGREFPIPRDCFALGDVDA